MLTHCPLVVIILVFSMRCWKLYSAIVSLSYNIHQGASFVVKENFNDDESFNELYANVLSTGLINCRPATS